MQGIKFNEDGITAILKVEKTMTRRPIKDIWNAFKILNTFDSSREYSIGILVKEYSKYKRGETVRVESHMGGKAWVSTNILLRITNIKVERLHNISEEDCIKESIIDGWPTCEGLMNYPDDGEKAPYYTRQEAFSRYVWDKLPYQPPYDWNSNPYVFVYEFEVVK